MAIVQHTFKVPAISFVEMFISRDRFLQQINFIVKHLNRTFGHTKDKSFSRELNGRITLLIRQRHRFRQSLVYEVEKFGLIDS